MDILKPQKVLFENTRKIENLLDEINIDDEIEKQDCMGN